MSNPETQMPDPDQLLSQLEVAKLLRVSTRMVSTLVGGGDLTAIRVGERSIRFSRKDLQAFIESGRNPGGKVE